LEFRILANGTDDGEGIAAARAALDGKSADELKARAEKGLAPEGPEGEFDVNIGDSRAKVRYLWAELAAEERESLGLSNTHEHQPGLWATMAARRGKTVPVRSTQAGYGEAPDNQSATMLLFSRASENLDQLGKEEQDRQRLKRENPGWSAEELERNVNPK